MTQRLISNLSAAIRAIPVLTGLALVTLYPPHIRSRAKHSLCN